MAKRYSIPAIVLGMTANGLGVVRSLARNGVKVYALDSYIHRPAMKTRYATCLSCPDVQKNPKAFSSFLLKLTDEVGGKAVLFPTSDAHNEYVNEYRNLLDPSLFFSISPKPVMDQLLNKKGQYEIAVRYGIPSPKTFFPETIEQIEKISQELKYPVILKGLSTGNWRARFGDQKAVVVKTSQELIESYRSIHQIGQIETILQEIIPGEDTRHYKICVYMNKAGEPLLTFTLQKIRQYPCDFGIGSSVISVWIPEIAEMGIKFMKKMGYCGVGSIEFKKDTRDEQFKMIEINPRLWAQNSLPEACGQNFAFTAYLDLLGEKVEAKAKFKEGIKWIALNVDRASFKGYLAQGRITWGKWLKSILTGRRTWAIWAMDDPMPFLTAIKFGFLPFEKVISRLQRK